MEASHGLTTLATISRRAAFLLQLRDSGVRFVAADAPEADETVVGIMAVIAQRELKMIGQRTKDGGADLGLVGTDCTASFAIIPLTDPATSTVTVPTYMPFFTLDSGYVVVAPVVVTASPAVFDLAEL